MAWNGSNDRRGDARRVDGGERPSRVRGAVAALSVVVVAALAFFLARHFLSGGGDGPQAPRDRGKPAKIADAAPRASSGSHSAATNTIQVNEAADVSQAEPNIRFTDTNSAMWRVYHNKGPVITNNYTEANASLSARVFGNMADKQIGHLLSIVPGTPLYGPAMKYDERFVRSFLKSLKTPIVIEKGDTEEVAALKRAVRETKVELKARYDAGEDIAKIMTDTRNELQQLGAYRDQLQAEVNKMLRKDAGRMTDRDMQDFIDAANMMLEGRGAKPLAMPGIMRHRLRMQAEKSGAYNHQKGDGP